MYHGESAKREAALRMEIEELKRENATLREKLAFAEKSLQRIRKKMVAVLEKVSAIKNRRQHGSDTRK